MKVLTTPLPGVLLIEPQVFRDDRGFFLQTYHQSDYERAGLPATFVQDNHSRSAKGILRGLHAQRAHPQGKLVRIVEGEVLDICVDIRRGSPTYKKWHGFRLSADNFLQLYVPPGYAHGFYVVSDMAQMEYKCTDFYDPADELRLIWNDPDIAVEWPTQNPTLSAKDRAGQSFQQLESQFPVYNELKK